LVFWEDGGGTEAQIQKDGDLLVSRRFEEGWQTLQWAEEERKYFERGDEKRDHNVGAPNGEER
jgi:hypothetical protein